MIRCVSLIVAVILGCRSGAEPPRAHAGEDTAVFSRFTYVDTAYPFLRKDETPDVLGDFFNINSRKPPNIVILQIEGLGRAFSGPKARLGSFTPFLDELMEKSLYWENFLASAGRTFASLPSISASLPFGEKGFSDFGAAMPKHYSILSILKDNGYRTAFFCGEDLDYDNQGLFMRRQNVNLLVGINDYDPSFIRIPEATWGYADKEILTNVLQMDRRAREPYISYVQTISIHEPYAVPGQQEYFRRLDRKDRRIFSCILYTDDALRDFFREYASLPAFANTIFIITGDHRLVELPMPTKIDRYHVPLMIYSPLLKRPARIRSVSSHFDIAPSLIAFLKSNYGIRAPELVTWIGGGLDVEPGFRNLHKFPIKQTKHNLVNFVSGRYFLDNNTLFQIADGMALAPIQNAAVRRRIRAEFEEYKARNNRFFRERKLIP